MQVFIQMIQPSSDKENSRLLSGTVGGALLGGALAGPPGAVVGTIGGYLLAKTIHEEKTMTPKHAFISFDYDNDSSLKVLLVGQAAHSDSPFDIRDMSIKEAISKDWKDKARTRIKGCDVVVVICGQNTHTAKGVSAEVEIAQEEGIPYFLLKGYSTKICTAPTSAKSTDKIYSWTWPNLKALINGER